MDADIDIEEHDLLDNPTIRKIFPDISILKKEISDEAMHIKQDPEILKVSEVFPSLDVTRDNNKETNQTSENSDSEPEIVFVEKRQPPLFSNKIILGSKPAVQCKIEVESAKITEKIYSSKIRLEDIGPYLKKSKAFCKNCDILFPRIESLQLHNDEIHSENMESYSKVEAKSMPAKLYKCEKCCRNFSRHGNLVKHLRALHHVSTKTRGNVLNSKTRVSSVDKVWNQITQSRHSRKGIAKPKELHCSLKNKCFHCNKTFLTKQSLIEHIYMVLRTNKTRGKSGPNALNYSLRSKMQLKAIPHKFVSKSHPLKSGQLNTAYSFTQAASTSVYRCFYCTYCFSDIKVYFHHITKKHKDLNTTKIKKVLFDGQCKYCSRSCPDWKLYNSHLHRSHKEKVNNTFKLNPRIIIPRLKVGVEEKFNCNNVDLDENINSLIDVNKDDDMDVFLHDDNDDMRAEEQNENGSPLNSFVLKSILFKCKRCDIHFLTAKLTSNHKSHMEMLINWKCHICHRIFKKQDEFAHMKQHLMPCRLTVIELEANEMHRVLYKCCKCAIHFSEDKYFSHYLICETVVAESVYCKLCDFLIDKSMGRCHSNNHQVKKLEVTDYTIINSDVIKFKSIDIVNNTKDKSERTTKNENKLYSASKAKSKECSNKRKMNYEEDFYLKLSYCDACKCFVTRVGLIRKAHTESRCTHMRTTACKYCGLVFTPIAMRGHKRLHEQRKDLKLQDFIFYSMRDGKKIVPPVPQYPKCHKCDVHFLSKVCLLSHVCNDTDFLTCHFCNIKISESFFKLHMAFHYYSKKQSKDLQSIVVSERKETTNSKKMSKTKPDLKNTLDLDKPNAHIQENKSSQDNNPMLIDSDVKENKNTKPEIDLQVIDISVKATDVGDVNRSQTLVRACNVEKKSDYELFNILYACTNCYATIDTYDKVVEHCQDHLCGVEIETDICETCNMVFERKHRSHHAKLHNANGSKTDLKLLQFDVFFFTLGNSVWVEHIFESVREKKTKSILNRSIYRKSKIKMKVIQDGSPDLTVYKCISCGVIVDPDSLLKHADTSCFKIRKYPCSLCGLPFLSYLSRQEHMIIHKTRNVFLKSYRIVVFNQENDKEDNRMLTNPTKIFQLYQCRNCSGVVDKYQRKNHECNKNDLKKCGTCDLLIRSADYKIHCIKHEKVPTFIQKNINVILFGQTDFRLADVRLKGNDGDISYFDGTFVDYTFYRCVDCNVCLDKSQIARLKHSVCYDDTSKSLCLKCDMIILKKKMAQHTKMHERYEYFVKENMNVIPYTVSELQANFVPADQDNPKMELKNTESQRRQVSDPNTFESEVSSEKVVLVNDPSKSSSTYELTAKLFKCICGLHFLDSSSIREHFTKCNSKVTKQRCSKCSYLFTPNVLFDHLLKHHGDKIYNYKFHIIEMSKEKCDIVTLYKCTHCSTHFIDYESAKLHYENCLERSNDVQEKCKKCGLCFDVGSIEHHENEHHKASVAEFDVIDIKTHVQELQVVARSLDNTKTFQADFIIDSKKYNISEDTLSRIDLRKYNNCIYKCEQCSTHFLSESTLKAHFALGHNVSPQAECNICGLNFSLQSLTKHIYIHHKQFKFNVSDFVFKFNYAEQSVQEKCSSI